MRRFANDFHECRISRVWRIHDWKSLANRLTCDPIVVIHSNSYIILFLTRQFMSWTHKSTKNNYRYLISPLSLRTVFSDLALWRHYSWFVTSCERRVLALWRHIRRLLLQAQFGTKAMNNRREYRFFTTGIHCLECSKMYLKMAFGKCRMSISMNYEQCYLC